MMRARVRSFCLQASKCLVVAKVLQSQRTLATSSWLAIRPQGLPKDDSPGSFKPKRALILTKVSRYEFERRRMEQANQDGKSGKLLNEDDFEEALTRRGSDYNLIKRHHVIHKNTETKVIEALKSRGIEVRCIRGFNYDSHHIEWADVIFTTGGDGTFLLGASKILSRDKPVIGFNTDPTRSEGHLCLPKRYSAVDAVDDAVDAVLTGKFRWMFRRRLRVTLTGEENVVTAPAIELHNQQLQYPEYRFFDFLQEQSVNASDHPLTPERREAMAKTGGYVPCLSSERAGAGRRDQSSIRSRVLPVLALNEVFFGESLSSRVSYLEVKFDSDAFIKSRNSGLCISTGTGSTSWTYNINKLTSQTLSDILHILKAEGKCKGDPNDRELVRRVTQTFNNELIFDAEANQMSYTIRDPISMTHRAHDYPDELGTSMVQLTRRPRGKAERIEVKSKCFEACLVIDGSLSYIFNDGTHASVEIRDEDALRTVQLDI